MTKTSLPARPDLPHSVDAEQCVLGGLMLDNERWDEVVLVVSVADFFGSAHRRIFNAMTELVAHDQPLDLITLSGHLEHQGQLELSGGFAYLAELSKNIPSAANIMAYSQTVAEKSRLRSLLETGHAIVSDAGASGALSTDVLERAEGRLFSLAESGNLSASAEVSTIQSLHVLTERLESALGMDGITGTPTGFQQIDNMTCGLQSSDLILMAARPSMGKTSLALCVCDGALQYMPDKPVFIFSLEMPHEQLMMRLAAMRGRIVLQRLRSGEMDDEDWARFSSASGRLVADNDRLIIDDTSSQTPATLRARARRYVRKYGRPSLIMVDYLQLMRAPEQENRTQEIAEISRSLKALAKELECPVLALSQLNRQLEQRADKRPNNGDLRDSGALEQDADVIMFIYRDEVYNANSPDEGTAEIIISKQRQGPTGTARVKFDGRYTLFEDFTEGQYEHSRGGRDA
jgi:replicative DNA helicase